jgi:hypothetical protein
MNRQRAWRCALLAALAAALAGCAGYRLGPTNNLSAGARSIQVAPFENKTPEPRLVEAVTAALRKQLQQDGTYRLDTRDEGDIVVTGAITTYERRYLTFQPGDVLTPRDYRVSVTARVTARDRRTGTVLLDRPVTGRSDIRVGSDLVSAERQALPLVAEDLARRATSLLTDGSW